MSQLRMWHPSKEEVDRLITGLRPLLAELARKDQDRIAEEVLRRRRLRDRSRRQHPSNSTH